MRPFYLRLGVYVMAEDKPDAIRRGGWLRAAAITNHMVPAVIVADGVADSDIASRPAVARMVDQYTRPAHGPVASDLERDLVLRGLTIAQQGDLTAALSILHAIEAGAGYLPASMARNLIERYPAPAPNGTAVAA